MDGNTTLKTFLMASIETMGELETNEIEFSLTVEKNNVSFLLCVKAINNEPVSDALFISTAGHETA